MLKATQGAGYARTVLSKPHALSAMLQEWDNARKEPEDLEAVWGPPRKRLSFWGKVGKSVSGSVILVSEVQGAGGSDLVHQKGRNYWFIAGLRSRVGVEMTWT